MVLDIDRLSELVEVNGIRQRDIAKATGLNPARISHILNGHLPPTDKEAATLTKFITDEAHKHQARTIEILSQAGMVAMAS